MVDDYETVTESAAFGQIRGSLSSSLSAAAGMRVGWLQSPSSAHSAGFADTGSPPVAAISDRETLPPTPRLDLSFQPEGHNLFYAAIAKGFRAGGPGTPARCAGTVDPSSFGPDSVWSFEVGTKDELFDRRLRLDTNLFDIRWDGIQERFQDSCGNSFTTNAGVAWLRYRRGCLARSTIRGRLPSTIQTVFPTHRA